MKLAAFFSIGTMVGLKVPQDKVEGLVWAGKALIYLGFLYQGNPTQPLVWP
jgi:hypothetical protein